ncbi:MAG: hypothetical protein A3F84_18670 [Candidatus Handelsmanbacteria bacterium RIFCSPLOWO2_12_FULL_64_10]|uniref:Type II toxin-antitoxin system PemK/MazF family toxin n=1 Tax=Handelsmanbacteria sp. (strain RIFCSPLOWO2_12_FULL_64_10) TaxID=1817868 RepID=A0A1F6CC45_HANXR|nr:MAG: hypothetical protein A3F84_18670 [Candidatus Handelsmanbacteria bacterium RIFCSPLOWO2_12_FULL_64_10]
MQPPKPRRGEIWNLSVPGEADPALQPALIISEDVRNGLSDGLIVIPAFSSGRLGPTRVPIAGGCGGLAGDSVLFCEEVTRVGRDALSGGPLGPRVPERLLQEVMRAIRRALGEVIL